MSNWNADLYDTRLAMVTHYGDNLLDLLAPQPGERILDLGCGTGRHAAMIAAAGADVIGIDSSHEMITRARANYPETVFKVMDGHSFRFDKPFDAVFSNAALHWMLEPGKVIDRVWHALKPGGRFVLEMGGQGNIAHVRRVISEVLSENGFPRPVFPWFFPSTAEYAGLLEAAGFRVTYVRHYDRPTKMVDPEKGLRDWLTMFGTQTFAAVPEHDLPELVTEIEKRLRKQLHKNGFWYIDYIRLQVEARKTNGA